MRWLSLRSGLSRCFSILCFFPIFIAATNVQAAGFTARAVGDFNQVAVIEVEGNFDALDPYGQVNAEPRRALAREFYRSHGDDYDFLVIFTNFDVRMPSLQAKAFFSPARNNVQGIGLPLYDHTAGYSADGAPLTRLEGTIDMGNLAAHALDPADPRFETTLRVLAHELLHRWGAYLGFLDAGTESGALLGLDRAHWSFLLDSQGSTLYGNRWQDNGDGTYTALTPESAHPGELFGRLFNPLELYLMGLAGAEQVPPLKLIDAPGIDAAQLPAPGVTIPGVQRSVAIDDIIALEGPRIPSVADSRKELRMGFVLAVAPGSFSAEAPLDVTRLAALGALRRSWEERFAILTDGQARMSTALVPATALAENPALPDDVGVPATVASLDAGVAWLLERQLADGRWQGRVGTALRDTAESVKALAPYPSAAEALARGRQWLRQAIAGNRDFEARRLAADAGTDRDELLAAVNPDGGWGGVAGFVSNPLDTALALQALGANSLGGAVTGNACSYLQSSQQSDGSWNAGSGSGQLLPTSAALLALDPFRGNLTLEPVVAGAQGWLAARQHEDGSFGQPAGSVADTALALLALKTSGGTAAATQKAVNWLLGAQWHGGSWQGEPYATAVAVQALHASRVTPDLAVSAADMTFEPPLLQELPGEVAVRVVVRNLGEVPVEAMLALYAGSPGAGGGRLDEQRITVEGKGSTLAVFTVPVALAGVHPFHVMADAEGEVKESDEWNNVAGKSLVASLPPPTVGFAEAAVAAAEGSGTVTLPIALSHPWPEAISVSYAAADGGSAVPGSDFHPLAGTLVIPAGESAAEIKLQLLDDLLAEPDKTLTLRLSAAAPGSIGTGNLVLTLHDDESPALAIASPPAAWLGTASPSLQYTTTAGEVQVFVDGGPVDVRSGEVLGPLADGTHVLEVVASNSLGMSTRQRVDFIVDTSLPLVAIHSPLPGVSNEPAPLLAFNLGGASGYRLTLDGQPLARSSGERLAPLAEGQHLLVLTAWNAVGAQVSTEVRFAVDTTPPVVEILYPHGDVLREVAPKLYCRLEETAAASVRVDGVAVPARCGERLGPLDNGPHRVEVRAADAVGNSAVATADFIVFTGNETAYPPAAGWPRQAAKFYGGLAVDRRGEVYLATQDAGYTLVIQKYSGQGSLLWQKRPFTRTLIPQDLAVDAAGNLFVVGYDSSGDGFLYKFAAADGSYLAGHIFATAGSDFASAVQVDADGQVVVAGDTGGDLYGAPNGSMNLWIARFDNDCRLLAGRQLTRSGTQEIAGRGSLALDAAGNAYLAGFTDAATFGTARGGDDAFVVKFDRNLWPATPALQFGTAGNDQALDVAVDIDGNLYVGGVSEEPGYYFENGFVYKFDAAGNLLRQVTTGSQPINALACERDGTLYALDDLGKLDKFDPALNLLWSRSLGWNYRHQLARDPAGDLYAAGDGGTSGSYASVIKLADARRPAVSIDASLVQTNLDRVTLSGTIEAGASLTLVNPGLQPAGAVVYPQPGRWQLTVAGLGEGLTEVVLQATAVSGFTRQVRTTVNVDLVPPQVTIAAPLDGQSYASKPLLLYTISDGRAEVLVNGVPLYKASGQVLEALRSGWNTIRVEATDPAGNVGSATVRIFAEGAAVGEWPLSEGSYLQAGTSGDETVVAMARDAAGYLSVLGYTTGSFPGYVNAGGRDPFIARFDPTGRHLATWQFGVAADESGGTLVADPDGNLLVTWNVQYVNTRGQADFAVRLAKLTAAGNVLWQTELNSAANEQVKSLALAPGGDVLLAGETYGSLDKQRYGGSGDYFLARYSAGGGKRWVRLSNAASSEALQAIAVDATGTIYGGALVGSALAGVAVPEHVALLRFDAAGTLLKVEPVPLPESNFGVRQMLVDAAGRVITAGGNGSRYFVAAHDGQLTRQWLEMSAPADGVALTAMTADPHGGLYLAGQVASAFAGNRAFGGSDVVVVKHAPTGARLWSQQFGSSGDDCVGGLAAGVAGELWVGGQTLGQLGASRIGSSDLYLARLARPDAVLGPKLAIDPCPAIINSTVLTVSGTTTPGATVTVVNGPAAILPAAVDGDGRWQLLVTGLVSNADNRLVIEARNDWGATIAPLTIGVDTVPPLLTVEPLPAAVVQPTLVVSGTLETGASLTIETAQGSAPVTAVAGRWSQTLTGLVAGENPMTLRAADAAGNRTVVELVIEYVPPPPPTLTCTPAVIGAEQATDLVLTVGQVFPPGSSVQVTRVLDLDGNGHADPGDPVVDRFTVTDGVLPADLNRPGDVDAQADGSVTVRLNGHFTSDRLHAPGEYLFTAETAGGLARAGLAVLASPQAQVLDGTVRDEAGAPVGGALIEMTDRWRHSQSFARSDRDGRYRFAVASPGEYLLWPVAEGYAARQEAPVAVLVPEGGSRSQELSVQRGPHQLSGTVFVAGSQQGLAGVTVRATSAMHRAETITDQAGRYGLSLPSGTYALAAGDHDGSDLGRAGLLGRLDPLLSVAVDTDLSGVDLAVAGSGVAVCGTVRTASGAPLAGVPVEAVDAGSRQFSLGLSDGAGRYCVGVADGDGWRLGHPDRLAFAGGWLGVQSQESATADLTVYPLDARMEGKVTDGDGNPLAGVALTVSHPLGVGMSGKTATDGSYRLGLSGEPAGMWSLTVDGQPLGLPSVTLADLAVAPGAILVRNVTLQRPALANTIAITRAVYEPRKQTLTVEATSGHANAQLQVEGFGAMTPVRFFKGKYYWSLTRSSPVRPATVTVSGPEGSVTAPVQ